MFDISTCPRRLYMRIYTYYVTGRWGVVTTTVRTPVTLGPASFVHSSLKPSPLVPVGQGTWPTSAPPPGSPVLTPYPHVGENVASLWSVGLQVSIWSSICKLLYIYIYFFFQIEFNIIKQNIVILLFLQLGFHFFLLLTVKVILLLIFQSFWIARFSFREKLLVIIFYSMHI